jgi:hypothetical protein
LASAIENIRKQDVHSVEDLKVLEETIRGQVHRLNRHL